MSEKLPKFSKGTINIIRTTLRNNIELTNIADNKANMLLSLNGIMISILVPLVLSNSDLVWKKYMYIPLIMFVLTCFSTMYISTMVLRPSNFENFKDKLLDQTEFSPFFFGNFFKMEPQEFFNYLNESMGDKDKMKMYLAQDLYFVGKRLGFKMQWVRIAFSIFITGIGGTLAATGILFFMF